MTTEPDAPPDAQSPLKGRVLAAFTLALAIALSVYLLMSATRSGAMAFASLWFLAVLPAYLCALICYVGDPAGTRSAAFYFWVPPALVCLVVVGSAWFLGEGVICLIMLAPIWLVSGMIGAGVVRKMRRRRNHAAQFHASLLFLPLMAGTLESQIPVPHEQVTLTRSIIVHASPAQIWPYAVSNAHIGAQEGRWTFSQDILGLPRPRATVLDHQGVGAVRTAYWSDNIDFEERVTAWQPGRRLAWRFAFTNSSLQNHTDQHIAPDGPFLKIDTGDYVLTPLPDGTTKLTLRTNYNAKTHVNLYARWWGELLLGDIQNNVLAVIKHRAESGYPRR